MSRAWPAPTFRCLFDTPLLHTDGWPATADPDRHADRKSGGIRVIGILIVIRCFILNISVRHVSPVPGTLYDHQYAKASL